MIFPTTRMDLRSFGSYLLIYVYISLFYHHLYKQINTQTFGALLQWTLHQIHKIICQSLVYIY